MYLENNELDKSDVDILETSHLEATVTFGELMTASGYFTIGYPSMVSIITLSALADTGFYAQINF